MKHKTLGMVFVLMGLVLSNGTLHAVSFVNPDPAFTFVASDFKAGTLNSIDCVATTPDGKVMVVGEGSLLPSATVSVTGSWVIRLKSDGSLDSTFQNKLALLTQCSGIAVSSDGQQIAVADKYANTALITKDGNTVQYILPPDYTTTAAAFAKTSLVDLAFTSDGKLIEVIRYFESDYYVVRYVNGVLDASYNGNVGSSLTGAVSVIQLDSQNSVFEASGNTTSLNWNVIIQKQLANGVPDTTFFPNSSNKLVLSTPFIGAAATTPPTYILKNFAVQTDGNYFVAGVMEGLASDGSDCTVFSRVKADGTLDTSFGNTGIQEFCNMASYGDPSSERFSIRPLESGGTLVVSYFPKLISTSPQVRTFDQNGKLLHSILIPNVGPLVVRDSSSNSFLVSNSLTIKGNVVGLKRYLVTSNMFVPSQCPTGSEELIVSAGSTQYASFITSKCVQTTDPGDQYSCPAGKVLLSAKNCTTTPNTTPNYCPSGQYTQSVLKCVELNPELDSQCASSNATLIAAGGTCIGATAISTYPDASGKCAAGKAVYSLSGVQLCSVTAAVNPTYNYCSEGYSELFDNQGNGVCAQTTDPDANNNCGTGQTLFASSICTTTVSTITPNNCPSGYYPQGVVKCAALTPDNDSICQTGQISAGGGCIYSTAVMTHPDASGNCPKDQVLNVVNGVKLCGSAAAILNDTTAKKDTGSGSGSEPSSGGGGCSLIR